MKMKHTGRLRPALSAGMFIAALMFTLSQPITSRAQTAPTGPAGGDLAGTYPNPALAADRVRKTGDTMTGALNIMLPNPGTIVTPFTITSGGNALQNRGTALAFNVPHGGANILGGKITSVWGSYAQTFMSFSAYNNGAFNEIFRVDGRGFFGIGTVSPAAGLDVQTPITSASAYGVRLQQTLTAAGNNSELTALFINPNFVNGVAVGAKWNALATGAGNIGFGTSSPGAGLDVQNPGVYNPAGTSIGTRFQQTLFAGNNTISTGVYINPIFSDGYSVGVRHNGLVVASGDVGIGTSTPIAKLDVQGGKVNASDGLCIAGDCKTSWAQVGGGGPATLGAVNVSSGQFGSGTGGGNYSFPASLGVGTSTPGFKLDVQGGKVNASDGLCIAGICKGSWTEVNAGSGGQWSTPNTGGHINNTNAGNVGIGTLTPTAKLDIAGPATGSGPTIRAGGGGDVVLASGGSLFFDGNYAYASGSYIRPVGANTQAFFTAGVERLRISGAGNVGIGTTSPAGKLDIAGGADANGAGDLYDISLQYRLGGFRHRISSRHNSGAPAGNAIDFYVWKHGADTPNALGTQHVMTLDGTGNVGIGTTNPAPEAKLQVQGNVSVIGDISATGNIAAKYQDVAEWVPSRQKLVAGTVVVLDTERSNHVMASSTAYDMRVAGVVSAAPGVILGEGGEGKVMVATTGRVRIKVDAARGPVRVGDLLVTSDVEGVAMKSEPLSLGGVAIHRPGTLIGKALEPLEKGVGEILVLLSLQ